MVLDDVGEEEAGQIPAQSTERGVVEASRPDLEIADEWFPARAGDVVVVDHLIHRFRSDAEPCRHGPGFVFDPSQSVHYGPYGGQSAAADFDQFPGKLRSEFEDVFGCELADRFAGMGLDAAEGEDPAGGLGR